MKLNKDSLIYFSLIFVVPFLLEFTQILSTQDSVERNRTEKELRNLFSKMTYIEGGAFTMGLISSEIRMTASDSTLFKGGIPKRTVVDPYYISATEVTNVDWRELYQAKVVELGESIGKRKFFLTPPFG
jgi:formylglycine-generating enzyme required for sulfatase activity